MAILEQFSTSDKAADVLATLNAALTTIKAHTADIAALKSGGTTTPSPSPSPSPSPTPSPTPAPSGTVVYPASGQSSTVSDSGYVEVSSAEQRMEYTYKNATVAGVHMLGLNIAGDGIALVQQSDNIYNLRSCTAFSVGDPLAGGDNTLAGSNKNITIPDGANFAFELDDSRAYIKVDGVIQPFPGAGGGYDVSGYIKGTGARYKKHAGGSVAGFKITRQ